MSKIQNYATLLAVAIFFLACGGSEKKTNIITIDQLVESVDDYVNDTIRVMGFCSDVCNHGGRHAILRGEGAAELEVRADQGKLSFSYDVLHSDIAVRGVLTETKVSKEFLNNWEFRLDESIKDGGGNPTAVAEFKKQIEQIRAIISEREKTDGRDYWSQYKLQAIDYEVYDQSK